MTPGAFSVIIAIMDMTGLEYFISAARHLNFTKAADECCITQTAMSLHIAKIEKELGFKLFFREHRAVRLTQGGTVFREEALKILRQYKEGVQRSASAAAGYEGALRIGFTNYIERTFLPELVGRFHRNYPRIELVLNKNEQFNMADDLKQGISDISVVFPYEVENDSDLSVEIIDSYRICAVVSSESELADKKTVKLRDLERSPVIINSPANSPRLFQRVLEDWKSLAFSPESIVESDSADGMLFLVEAGFGAALMPSYVRQLQNDRIRVLDLEDGSFSIEMAVAWLKENSNPAVDLFLKDLRAFQPVS